MYKLSDKYLNREEAMEQVIEDGLEYPNSFILFALFGACKGLTDALYEVVNKGISHKDKQVSQSQIDDSLRLLENNNYIIKLDN